MRQASNLHVVAHTIPSFALPAASRTTTTTIYWNAQDATNAIAKTQQARDLDAYDLRRLTKENSSVGPATARSMGHLSNIRYVRSEFLLKPWSRSPALMSALYSEP
jgi:hypothetical protein